jgi:hypothetical protein
MSSFVATTANMVTDAAGIFLKPYQEYQKGNERKISATYSDPGSTSETGSQSTTNGMVRAGAMAAACGKSMGKFLGKGTKAILVDMPLAVTEGMRAVPQLYQDEVKDSGKVTDWKSGFVVAGKTFGSGMYEGLTDIVTEPVRMQKKEGSIGVAKGVGKGLVSIVTKTSSASLGLVAYPGQGIYKTLHSSAKSSTRKAIREAKLQEGKYLLVAQRPDPQEIVAVHESYDALRLA